MIGSGNVATVLSLKLKKAGYKIIQVYSKTKKNTKLLADKLNTIAIDNIKNISIDADLYIIAVSDDSILSVIDKISISNKSLVVHTAGAISKNVLKKCSKNYGVLYPIQSLRKNMNLKTPIPFAIDANNKKNIKTLSTIVNKIKEQSIHYNDEQRLKLHIAAVISSNFVNYLYYESATFCQKEHLNFSLLQPLIEETAMRIKEYHPKDVFTGPAVRKDKSTISKHKKILSNNPVLFELYNFITNKIINK